MEKPNVQRYVLTIDQPEFKIDSLAHYMTFIKLLVEAYAVVGEVEEEPFYVVWEIPHET